MIWWRTANETERKLYRALVMLFRRDPELLTFLLHPDRPRLRDSIEGLLGLSETCFTAEQDVLFRVGMDIWSGSGETRVWELLEFLDNDRLRLVLEALRYLGTKFDGWDGPPICRQLKFPSDNSRRQLKLDTHCDF